MYPWLPPGGMLYPGYPIPRAGTSSYPVYLPSPGYPSADWAVHGQISVETPRASNSYGFLDLLNDTRLPLSCDPLSPAINHNMYRLQGDVDGVVDNEAATRDSRNSTAGSISDTVLLSSKNVSKARNSDEQATSATLALPSTKRVSRELDRHASAERTLNPEAVECSRETTSLGGCYSTQKDTCKGDVHHKAASGQSSHRKATVSGTKEYKNICRDTGQSSYKKTGHQSLMNTGLIGYNNNPEDQNCQTKTKASKESGPMDSPRNKEVFRHTTTVHGTSSSHFHEYTCSQKDVVSPPSSHGDLKRCVPLDLSSNRKRPPSSGMTCEPLDLSTKRWSEYGKTSGIDYPRYSMSDYSATYRYPSSNEHNKTGYLQQSEISPKHDSVSETNTLENSKPIHQQTMKPIKKHTVEHHANYNFPQKMESPHYKKHDTGTGTWVHGMPLIGNENWNHYSSKDMPNLYWNCKPAPEIQQPDQRPQVVETESVLTKAANQSRPPVHTSDTGSKLQSSGQYTPYNRDQTVHQQYNTQHHQYHSQNSWCHDYSDVDNLQSMSLKTSDGAMVNPGKYSAISVSDPSASSTSCSTDNQINSSSSQVSSVEQANVPSRYQPLSTYNTPLCGQDRHWDGHVPHQDVNKCKSGTGQTTATSAAATQNWPRNVNQYATVTTASKPYNISVNPHPPYGDSTSMLYQMDNMVKKMKFPGETDIDLCANDKNELFRQRDMWPNHDSNEKSCQPACIQDMTTELSFKASQVCPVVSSAESAALTDVHVLQDKAHMVTKTESLFVTHTNKRIPVANVQPIYVKSKIDLVVGHSDDTTRAQTTSASAMSSQSEVSPRQVTVADICHLPEDSAYKKPGHVTKSPIVSDAARKEEKHEKVDKKQRTKQNKELKGKKFSSQVGKKQKNKSTEGTQTKLAQPAGIRKLATKTNHNDDSTKEGNFRRRKPSSINKLNHLSSVNVSVSIPKLPGESVPSYEAYQSSYNAPNHCSMLASILNAKTVPNVSSCSDLTEKTTRQKTDYVSKKERQGRKKFTCINLDDPNEIVTLKDGYDLPSRDELDGKPKPMVEKKKQCPKKIAPVNRDNRAKGGPPKPKRPFKTTPRQKCKPTAKVSRPKRTSARKIGTAVGRVPKAGVARKTRAPRQKVGHIDDVNPYVDDVKEAPHPSDDSSDSGVITFKDPAAVVYPDVGESPCQPFQLQENKTENSNSCRKKSKCVSKAGPKHLQSKHQSKATNRCAGAGKLWKKELVCKVPGKLKKGQQITKPKQREGEGPLLVTSQPNDILNMLPFLAVKYKPKRYPMQKIKRRRKIKREVSERRRPEEWSETENKRLFICRETGETVLHKAARKEYVRVALDCLKSGEFDVNVRDNAGYTPLHESCVSGNLTIARALIDRGADPNAKAFAGTRPIHDAVGNNHLEHVRLLLAHGADPTISNYLGRTLFSMARSAEMRRFLLDHLSDLNDGREPWVISNFTDTVVGYDVLAGAPSDSELDFEEDVIFELSAEPQPSTLHLRLNDRSGFQNYHLVEDIAKCLGVTNTDDFVRFNGDLCFQELSRGQILHQLGAHSLRGHVSDVVRKVHNSQRDIIHVVEIDDALRDVLCVSRERVTPRDLALEKYSLGSLGGFLPREEEVATQPSSAKETGGAQDLMECQKAPDIKIELISYAPGRPKAKSKVSSTEASRLFQTSSEYGGKCMKNELVSPKFQKTKKPKKIKDSSVVKAEVKKKKLKEKGKGELKRRGRKPKQDRGTYSEPKSVANAGSITKAEDKSKEKPKSSHLGKIVKTCAAKSKKAVHTKPTNFTKVAHLIDSLECRGGASVDNEQMTPDISVFDFD